MGGATSFLVRPAKDNDMRTRSPAHVGQSWNTTGTMKQTSLFEHRSLEDRNSIRLLCILAGMPNDELHCECIHFPHCRGSQTPPYTAISYTRGDPSPEHPIMLNGRMYYLPRNANDILLRVRSPHENRMIWIDKICIDQTNITEKNNQVRLMVDIYSSAQQTLVWLGPATEDSALAMDFILVLKQALEELEGFKEVTDKMLLEKTSTYQDSPPWSALGNLFARPWFQRVWVVQEITLSPTVYFMCGDRTLPWEDVGNVMDVLYNCGLLRLINQPAHPLNQLTSGISTFWGMQDVRRSWRTLGSKRPLAAVLYSTMGLLAEDPKDQIFGVLGLIHHSGDTGLQPHYENTVQEVYMHAIQWSLIEEKIFDLLYLAGISHARNTPNLPSWVPDFSIDIAVNPFGIPVPGKSTHYAAGGSIGSTAISNILFNERCLIAQGVIVDTVDVFGHVRVPLTQERVEQTHKTWNQWIRQAMELVGTHQSPDFVTKVSKTLWRALIADTTHVNKEPAPPCYERYFQSFKEIYIDDIRYHDLDFKQADALVANDPKVSDDAWSQASQYYFSFLDASIGRRLCITERGNLGLVPSEVAKGDRVCVLLGAKAPFVVRETPKTVGGRRKYVLVGDCYIDGLMAGEGLMMGNIQEITLE